jgi:phosphomannomutase
MNPSSPQSSDSRDQDSGRLSDASGTETDSRADSLADSGAWLAVDPDPATAEQLEQLRRDDPAEVERLFDGRISFGTAGLRAALGPGPRLMNRVVVAQTTVGLLRWMAERGTTQPTIVLGYDARHGSRRFATGAAAEIAAMGGRAELIDGPVPTPVLAHAVIDRGADAGIMITASHNPAADNGYKLYLGDGIQLVSPADREIGARIDEVAADHLDLGRRLAGDHRAAAENRLRTVAQQLGLQADTSGAVISLDDTVRIRHRRAAVETLLTDHRTVAVLYTAMHGVGGRHLLDCFQAAGFPLPAVVAEQFEPDPDFPTAPFPNPEEPGVLDLAFRQAEQARRRGQPFDVIVANDPDADRLAVAVPAGGEDGAGNESPPWRRLSGDEVGALLLDHVFRHRSEAIRPLVASSIVSSRFINRIAEANGATSVRTLTGFKWVARPIVEQPEATYLMGYEEALGYCIGDRVRDKDGVSAALVLAELAAECKAEGTGLTGRLDAIIERFGLWATSQVTVSLAEMTDDEAEACKQQAVTVTPSRLAGIEVIAVENLAEGRHLPPTPGVVIDLADGSRVIIRPSGTEPKIKAYIEVVEPPGSAEIARAAARPRLEALADAVRALVVE